MGGQCEKERGQVLVIVALIIVGLLGFAALAVDTGMLYADRRHDQNTADTAALTAAGAAAQTLTDASIDLEHFSCTDLDVLVAIASAEGAAITSAAGNHFTLDDDLSDGHGVQVSCQDAGGSTGKYLDIEVQITSETQTSFVHLVFEGSLQNHVTAVTRVEPGEMGPFADGMALLALDENCEKANCSNSNTGGIVSCGGTDVTIETGSAYSNACLVMGGSGDVEAEAGIFYITEYIKNGSGDFDPDPAPATQPVRLNVDPPDCASLDSGATQILEEGKGKNKIVSMETWPGNYANGIALTGNVTEIRMHPGLYCLDGDFSANNGKIFVLGDNEDGVTLYFTDGNFDIAGNVEVMLRAPMEGSEGVPPAITGMLIFFAEDHDGEIKVRGTSNSYYRGTVYAPAAQLDVGGGSSMLGELASQFIANTVRIHGNPGMVINFDSGEIFQDAEPSYLGLYK